MGNKMERTETVCEDFKELRASEEVKPFYHPLMYALLIVGVDVFESKKEIFRAFRLILQLISCLVTLIAFLTGMIAFGGLADGFSPSKISSLLFYHTGVALRLVLFRKRRDLARLLRVLSSLQWGKDVAALQKQKKKFRVAAASLTAVWLIFLMLAVFVLYAFKVSSEFPALEESLKRLYLRGGALFRYSFISNFYLSCFVPHCIFACLFHCVSWHLREILSEAENHILASPLDFKSNHSIYSQLRTLVTFANQKLRVISNFASAHLAFTLYYLSFAVSANTSDKHWCALNAGCLVMVHVMIATMVHHAGHFPAMNEKILSTINSVPLDGDSVGERLSFIESVKQGVSLTLGDLIHIRKNTFFVIVGTFWAYSLLIQSSNDSVVSE